MRHVGKLSGNRLLAAGEESSCLGPNAASADCYNFPQRRKEMSHRRLKDKFDRDTNKNDTATVFPGHPATPEGCREVGGGG